MAWSFPHTFHDNVNEIASGTQINDNFTTARERIEAITPLTGQKYNTGVWNNGEERVFSTTRAVFVSAMVSAPAGSARACIKVGGVTAAEVQAEKVAPICAGPVYVPAGATVRFEGAGSSPVVAWVEV